MSPPETTIIWLRDEEGLFPYARFSGDHDMATDGWASFASRAGDEVVLAWLTASEWNSRDPGMAAAVDRIRKELNGKDIFYIQVAFEREGPSGSGMTFTQFRRGHHAMRARFAARSGAGEAVQVREETLDDFVSGGGQVTIVSPGTSRNLTHD